MLQQLNAAQIRQRISEVLEKQGKQKKHEIVFLLKTIHEAGTGELEHRLLRDHRCCPLPREEKIQHIGEYFISVAKNKLYEAAVAASTGAPQSSEGESPDSLRTQYLQQLRSFEENIDSACKVLAQGKNTNPQLLAELQDIQKAGLEFLLAFIDIIRFGRAQQDNHTAAARNRIAPFLNDDTARYRRMLYDLLFYVMDSERAAAHAPAIFPKHNGDELPLPLAKGSAEVYAQFVMKTTPEKDRRFVAGMLYSFLN